jgi:hypothetical protein
MTLRKIGLFAVLSVFASCGAELNSVKRIIGEDDRVEAKSSSIGGLSIDGGKAFCTGYFISNRKVVTASHCVDDAKDRIYMLKTKSNVYRLALEKLDEKTHTATLLADKQSKSWLEKSEFGLPKELIGVNKNTGKLSNSKVNSSTSYIIYGMLIHKFDTESASSGSPILNENGKVLSTHIGTGELFGESINVSSLGNEEIQLDILDEFSEECWDYNPFCGGNNKKVRVCKQAITVNAALYYACKASIAAVPASCTVGSALTAGTTCWANMGIAAAACGVSMKAIVKLGTACVNEASK